jgi:hypothetical protein
METQIALRKIASAAPHFSELRAPSGG